MTVGRRGVIGLGAAGLGLAALEGCGVGPPPPAASPGGPVPVPVDRLLAELDSVVRHLSALEATETSESSSAKTHPTHGRQRGEGGERRRTISLFIVLCLLGTYRELPPHAWRDPRVEAHMAASMPRIRSTLDSARAHLAAMTDAELAIIDARLQKEPDLPMRIMERVDRYGSEIDIPMEQRTYLRMSTMQLAGRYRYEGTREVTRKVLASYERILTAKLTELDGPEAVAKGGARPQPTRPESLAKSWPGKPLGAVGELCEADDDCREDLLCSRNVCAPQSSAGLRKAARRTAVVGAWLLLPPTCGIGALVLLQAVFLSIVARIVADDRRDGGLDGSNEGAR